MWIPSSSAIAVAWRSSSRASFETPKLIDIAATFSTITAPRIWPACSSTVSCSLTTAPIATSANRTAAHRPTSGRTAATRAGQRRRSAIPSATGTTVTISTRATIAPIPRSSTSALASKWSEASVRYAGTVIVAARLLTAVIVSDRAVSPRARWVSTFAIVPPGAAPSSTSPTARPAGRSNSVATPKASAGEITTRLSSPIATPRGCLATRRKSAGVSSSPSATMITASAAGSRTVVVSDSSTRARLTAPGRPRAALRCGAAQRGSSRLRASTTSRLPPARPTWKPKRS